jgi:hypothetical protein
MERAVKTFEHPNGQQRVLIVQRENATFGYEEEQRVHVYEDDEMRAKWPEMFWSRSGQYPLCICETAEIAEREARGAVPWLDLMLPKES